MSYADLPKIPVRGRHFMSDMVVLTTQFARTMVILQHHLFQRAFHPRQSVQQQHNFQIVHLHINTNTPNNQAYASSIQTPVLESENVPIIFPVRKGVWELVVRKSNLDKIRQSLVFSLPGKAWIEEMDVLPMGMAARVAQNLSPSKSRKVRSLTAGTARL
ncbi:MAG: hypothetical protein Q9216_001097 [Gyalolechia sp. 2 TL-2023]